ncbi:MAG: hypothetical protein ABR514_00395 [Chthoniobacterales bacterium]
MRTGTLIRIVAAVVLSVLNACALFQKPEATPALLGTWTNSLGSVWIIKDDGTFDVDLDQDGNRDGWGTWNVSGDTVTLRRRGGLKPKGCDGKGVYRFTRSDDMLQFALVSDACKLRRKNMLLDWRRK